MSCFNAKDDKVVEGLATCIPYQIEVDEL